MFSFRSFQSPASRQICTMADTTRLVPGTSAACNTDTVQYSTVRHVLNTVRSSTVQ